MDPLSVAASVVGLVAAGSKLSSSLYSLIGNVKDATSLAQHALQEINDIGTALSQLQHYITGQRQPPAGRSNMILLDQVLATLTGCVTTYSDLQTALDALKTDDNMNIFDRLKWVHNQSRVTLIIQRIQSHKTSMILMLQIMQSNNARDAENCMNQLCSLVQKVIDSNADLAGRMNGLVREGSILYDAQSSYTRESRTSISVNRRTSIGSPSRFAFEQELQKSRVYNKIARRFSTTSVTSTALHVTALSIFSKLSLGEVSQLSFYALPIYAADLSNSTDYVFGDEGAHVLELTNTSSTPGTRPQSYVNLGIGKTKLTPKAPPQGLLGRFARRPRRLEISPPMNPQHVTHTGYNTDTGILTGLPLAWQRVLERQYPGPPEFTTGYNEPIVDLATIPHHLLKPLPETPPMLEMGIQPLKIVKKPKASHPSDLATEPPSQAHNETVPQPSASNLDGGDIFFNVTDLTSDTAFLEFTPPRHSSSF